MTNKLQILHVIPGLDPGARPKLVSEHMVAIESIARAVSSFNSETATVEALVLADSFWPSSEDKLPTLFTCIEMIEFEGRALPKVFPMLEALPPNVDYIIFSNSDIGVWPGVYDFIVGKIQSGISSGSITRRTVEDFSSHTIPPQASTSREHPGNDFFFFPSRFLAELRIRNLVLGAAGYGLTMVLNLASIDREFKIFRDQYLTFHLGDDRVWSNPSASSISSRRHNYRNLVLCSLGIAKAQGAKAFRRASKVVSPSHIRLARRIIKGLLS